MRKVLSFVGVEGIWSVDLKLNQACNLMNHSCQNIADQGVVHGQIQSTVHSFDHLHFLLVFFPLTAVSTCVTCFTRFVLYSFQNKSKPLQVGDPPVIKAGICYTV